MVRRLLALIIPVLLLTGGAAAATAPAHAAALDVCGVAGENGNGDCMNDWSLSGNVYAYASGKTNEDFGAVTIDRCGGGDTVTGGRPEEELAHHGQVHPHEGEEGAEVDERGRLLVVQRQ